LILSLCYSGKSTAQPVYTIPWAVQQPQWVFPIWFEDGDGKRDTVYVGCDTLAGNSFNQDSILGSQFIWVDSSSLNFTGQYLQCDDSFCKTKKVILIKYYPGSEGLFGCCINFVNIKKLKLPLIMRWDVNVLNSPSFPFNPLGFSQPKGQLSVLTNTSYGWYSDIGCGTTEYLLITDSLMDPLPQGLFCITKDSVVVDNILNPGIMANVGLTIFIERWKGKPMNVGFQEALFYKSSISIMDNKLFVSTESKDGILRLYDISGKILLEKNITGRNLQVDVSFLSQSMFIAQIISIDKTENFKFINHKN
jgi:hypothetical protein